MAKAREHEMYNVEPPRPPRPPGPVAKAMLRGLWVLLRVGVFLVLLILALALYGPIGGLIMLAFIYWSWFTFPP